MALIKSIFIIGLFDKNRKYYWNLFFWSLSRKPKVFPLAITYSIYGYHYNRGFSDLAKGWNTANTDNTDLHK